MIRNIDIDLEFQPYIAKPPVAPAKLYQQACSSDEITVNSWRDIWIKNIKANHEKYGPFNGGNALSSLRGLQKNKPVIVIGSGPSLKYNVGELREAKDICLVSCLHNYHYLEDNGVKADYYVNLDAGDVTLEEIAEGGQKTVEEYLESTKDKTLITYIAASPKLLAAWKGKIIWYAAPIPDAAILAAIDAVEEFHQYVSTGGNVLGACFYIAKAVMGANPIIFVGADFCFSYDNKFHPWPSKYDKSLGGYMRAEDVFGVPRKTWQSYYQFKCWFDSRACAVPGLYINATEGGLLGAYPEGNIRQILQMSLKEVILSYSVSKDVFDQLQNHDEILQRSKSPAAKERLEELNRVKSQIADLQGKEKAINEQMVADKQVIERKILF